MPQGVAVQAQRTYTSVSGRGIDWGLMPARLFSKGKRLYWDPEKISFEQDKVDWKKLNEDEQDMILRLTSLFGAGEEAVTLDLLPLVNVMAQEGRLEEEMYLTQFLFEEAKHTEAFRRFLDSIDCHEDLHRYHTGSYQTVFYEALPQAMGRLNQDPSPAAQAEASVTYNMIVEGVLAETGYHAWRSILESRGLMPGVQEIISKIATDESRHIAYGVYLLSRLIAVDDEIYGVVQKKMSDLMVPSTGVINDLLGAYAGKEVPFGLSPDDFVNFAIRKFQGRMAVIERARGKAVDELYRAPIETFEEADA
ncbi:MAG: R2-like ligand-binding oxidase [Firmicutes bacterium]|nr:R2-like ligand-binding oxidase [Bacillota bacterium]